MFSVVYGQVAYLKKKMKTIMVKDNSNITTNTVSLPSAADGIRRDQRNKLDKSMIFSLVTANSSKERIVFNLSELMPQFLLA